MSDEFDLDVLAESFSEFLEGEWPKEKAIAYERSDQSYDADLWSAMAGLGWTALTAPEAEGGLGLGTAAAAHLHAALGAAVTPTPMLGTLLATTLLGATGAEGARGLLAGIIDGSLRVAVAEPNAVPVQTDGKTISGTARDLLDAPGANLLLVRIALAGQPGWVAIDADAPGVSIHRYTLADTTRSLGDVTLDNVQIGEGRLIRPTAGAALDDLLTRQACVAIAADSLGGGEAVLKITIEYMKVREQFGRLIGSFQALKHRVADHHAALVGARELVLNAATIPDDDDGALLAALSTKAHVAAVTADIARDCIQLHGGVGFTSEFSPHLYLKRAKLNEALYGTRTAILDRVADMLEAA
ncbi:MAG: acyl-CoA dehydrogenase family protein [Sphingomonadaceae bacterium]|nr:acyl-CoA dehydrogenase family protein [Sphingomonadaceae bacterium]